MFGVGGGDTGVRTCSGGGCEACGRDSGRPLLDGWRVDLSICVVPGLVSQELWGPEQSPGTHVTIATPTRCGQTQTGRQGGLPSWALVISSPHREPAFHTGEWFAPTHRVVWVSAAGICRLVR